MITLTPEELQQITGYRQVASVLRELHRQGFYRARRGPFGVILERAHFEAVCGGAGNNPPEPKLRLRAHPAASSSTS